MQYDDLYADPRFEEVRADRTQRKKVQRKMFDAHLEDRGQLSEFRMEPKDVRDEAFGRWRTEMLERDGEHWGEEPPGFMGKVLRTVSDVQMRTAGMDPDAHAERLGSIEDPEERAKVDAAVRAGAAGKLVVKSSTWQGAVGVGVDAVRNNLFPKKKPLSKVESAYNSAVQQAFSAPAQAAKAIAVGAKQLENKFEDLTGVTTRSWDGAETPEDAAELFMFELGDLIESAAREAYPTDEKLQGDFVLDVMPRAVASLTSYMAAGLAGGPVATGLLGAAQEGVSQYEAAEAAGVGEDAQMRAASLGYLVGMSEAIPVGRILKPLDKLTGGKVGRTVKTQAAKAALRALRKPGRERLRKATLDGATEMVQEIFQTTAGNKIAQEIYDENRKLFEGAGVAGAAGGITGAVASFVVGMLGGRRARVDGPTQQNGEAAALREADLPPRDEGEADPESAPVDDPAAAASWWAGFDLSPGTAVVIPMDENGSPYDAPRAAEVVAVVTDELVRVRVQEADGSVIERVLPVERVRQAPEVGAEQAQADPAAAEAAPDAEAAVDPVTDPTAAEAEPAVDPEPEAEAAPVERIDVGDGFHVERTESGGHVLRTADGQTVELDPEAASDAALLDSLGLLDPSHRRRHVRLSVAELSDELGAPIVVVDTVADLPQHIQQKLAEDHAGASPKGVYDTATGTAYVVADNTGVADAKTVGLHETLGHKGVEGLLGDRFHDFLDSVWDSGELATRVQEVADRLGIDTQRSSGWRTAAAEMLAETAEDSDVDPTLMDRIVVALREFLRVKFPNLELDLTDADVRVLLQRAREDLGSVTEASDRAGSARLRLSAGEQVKSAEELATSATKILYGESDVLPKPAKKVRNAKVAELLQTVAMEQWGGEIINSTTITPEQEAILVENGIAEFEAALNASGKNAANWYTQAIEDAMSVAEVLHPEMRDDAAARAGGVFDTAADAQLAMRMALAITSQNLTVPQNTLYAEEQFAILKATGKFDPTKLYGDKAESISGNLDLANVLIDAQGWEGLNTFLRDEFTVRELIAEASAVVGGKVTIAGRLGDEVNGAAVFGPKIGQGFLQNLFANYDPVTIDLWMRRTWGRWTGDVVEPGLTDERIARLLDAARDLGMKVPPSMRSARAVNRSRKTGASYRAMSPAFMAQLENNEAVRDEILDFATRSNSMWQKQYKLLHSGLTPAMKRGLVDGSVRVADAVKKLQRSEDALDRRWAALKRKPTERSKRKPTDQKETVGPKETWRIAQRAKQGRTEGLVKADWKAGALKKPEWSLAAGSLLTSLKPIDAPSNQDRDVISRIVNTMRKGLEARGYDVSNADIQAVLWYPEKDVWAKLRGEEESNDKQSYDTEFLKIAESRGLGEQARGVLAESGAARAGRSNDSGPAQGVRTPPAGALEAQAEAELGRAPSAGLKLSDGVNTHPNVSALRDALLAEHGARIETLNVSEGSDHIELHDVRVAGDARGNGVGGSILAALTQYAESTGKPVVLEAEPEKGKKGALDKLYRSHGFVPPGRRRDHALPRHTHVYTPNPRAGLRLSVTPEQDAEYQAAVQDVNIERVQALVDAAAAKAGYARVIRTIPTQHPNAPIRGGDWVALDTPAGHDYLAEYAGENWRAENWTPTAYVREAVLSDQQTGFAAGQTLVVGDVRHNAATGEQETDASGVSESDIKSADPVTYDDGGNVIPLGRRFNQGSDDIRLAVTPEQDAEYQAAVQGGNIERAQALVDAAAKAAGYGEGPVYHGTPGGALPTRFDPDKIADRSTVRGFFFTPEKRIAEKYAKGSGQIGTYYLKVSNPANDRFAEMFGENLDGDDRTFARRMADQMRAEGFDGVTGEGEMFVLDPSQIKSADPVTYDDAGSVIPLSERFNDGSEDVRLSVTPEQDAEYQAAVQSKNVERAQALVDAAAAAAGYDSDTELSHGTTHKFTVFSRDKANPDNDLGAGFYFSTSSDDAGMNYHEDGPDLTQRVEILAERLFDYGDGAFDRDSARAEARRRLVGEEPSTVKAYVKFENALVLGGEQETYIEPVGIYDEDAMADLLGEAEAKVREDNGLAADAKLDDYEAEVREAQEELADENGYYNESMPLIDAFNATARFFDDISLVSIEDLQDFQAEGVSASKLEVALRDIFGEATMPETGDSAGGEAIRYFFEQLGYDGIVDNTVNDKFGTGRKFGKSMDGLHEGVTHVIAFNPEQIKSSDPVTYDDAGNVIPLGERFNDRSDDLRFSAAAPTDAEAAQRRVKMAAAVAASKGLKPHRFGERVRGIGTSEEAAEQAERPGAYYEPQKIGERQEAHADLSDDELELGMLRFQSGTGLPPSAENWAVLDGLELMNRLRARSKDASLSPAERQAAHDKFLRTVDDLNALGMTAGQMLRQYAELKARLPGTPVAVLEAAWGKQRRALTNTQRAKLEQLAGEDFDARDAMRIAEEEMQARPTDANILTFSDAEAAAEKASRSFLDYAAELTPRKLTDLIRQMMQGNLLALTSQGINIASNVQRMLLEDLGQNMMAAGEAVIAFIAKRPRTLQFAKPGDRVEGAKRGLKRAGKELVHGAAPFEGVHGEVMLRGFKPWRSLVQAMSGRADPKMLVGEDGKVPVWDRVKKALEATQLMPEAQFRLLGLGDHPFKEGAYNAYLTQRARQLGLQGNERKVFMLSPPADVRSAAMEHALEQVYQQQGAVGKWLGYTLRNMRNHAVGDWIDALVITPITPFKTTPINVAGAALEFLYWPWSLTKAAYHGEKARRARNTIKDPRSSTAAREKAQRDFGRHHQRSMRSVGVAAVAYMIGAGAEALVQMGLATGAPDEDDGSLKRIDYATTRPYSINTSALARWLSGGDPAVQEGDTWRSAWFFGFFGMATVLSAQRARRAERGEIDGDPPMDAAMKLLTQVPELGSVMVDTTLLKGTASFLDAVSKNEYDRWLENYFGVIVSVGLPNQLAAVNRARQQYMPDMKRESSWAPLLNAVAQRNPFVDWEGAFPSRRDALGQPIERTPEGAPRWLYHLVDASKSGPAPQDPIWEEIGAVYKASDRDKRAVPSEPSRRLTVKGKKRQLSPRVYERMVELIGERRRREFYVLTSDPRYADLEPALQARALGKVWDAGYDDGKKAWLQEMGGTDFTP